MRRGSTGCLITNLITISLIIQYSIDRVLIYGKIHDILYPISYVVSSVFASVR